jgi:hypothetical protein
MKLDDRSARRAIVADVRYQDRSPGELAQILLDDDHLVGVRIGHNRVPVDVVYVLCAANYLDVIKPYYRLDSYGIIIVIIGSAQGYSGR